MTVSHMFQKENKICSQKKKKAYYQSFSPSIILPLFTQTHLQGGKTKQVVTVTHLG